MADIDVNQLAAAINHALHLDGPETRSGARRENAANGLHICLVCDMTYDSKAELKAHVLANNKACMAHRQEIKDRYDAAREAIQQARDAEPPMPITPAMRRNRIVACARMAMLRKFNGQWAA